MADIASIKGGGKSAAPAEKEKVVRYRLSKEQTAYVNDLVKLENRIAVCREYIALWMGFFRFFAEDLTQKEITANDEKLFFQTMTQISRKHFMFCELMADQFERRDDIINVLALAVSLLNIQGMNENTRSKLELDWHSIFLDMNKALGRLIRQLPGNLPLSQALEKMQKVAPAQPQTSAAAALGAAPAEKKKSGLLSKK